jgi:hypothetical protein
MISQYGLPQKGFFFPPGCTSCQRFPSLSSKEREGTRACLSPASTYTIGTSSLGHSWDTFAPTSRQCLPQHGRDAHGDYRTTYRQRRPTGLPREGQTTRHTATDRHLYKTLKSSHMGNGNLPCHRLSFPDKRNELSLLRRLSITFEHGKQVAFCFLHLLGRGCNKLRHTFF